MILNKYNEIMNGITVDPEMKSRIMGAVSDAIKRQAEGGAVVTDIPKKETRTEAEPKRRKKANRTPVIVISTIAALVVVFLGIMFVFRYLGTSKAASETVAMHNAAINEDTAAEIDAAVGNDEAYETAAQGNYEATEAEDTKEHNDSVSGEQKNSFTVDINDGDYNIVGITNIDVDKNEGMGDVRRDKISRALPFDLKATGTGEFADGISTEVFLGEQGQKVVLLTADQGTDLVKAFYPSNKSAGEPATTPEGTAVKLFRIPYANVLELGKDETSTEINAALYERDGKTYLLIFSYALSPDEILRVVDAV